MSNRPNSTPSPAIDRVLEFLARDNQWHTLHEIAQKTALPAEEVAEIINFLAANQFISLNEQGKKAKITEIVDRFMTQILEEEKLSAR
jgi:DNA-binding IclR family transcriptional regulator